MSYDILQVLMFICPTVSDLCFYGCCHPCFLQKCSNSTSDFLNRRVLYMATSKIRWLIFVKILSPFLNRISLSCGFTNHPNGELSRFCSNQSVKLHTKILTTLYNRIVHILRKIK